MTNQGETMTDMFNKKSITTALADRIIEAATRKATELDILVSIAIADESGGLKAFRRMDGANLISLQVSQDKAYTATVYGWDTDNWPGFLEHSMLLRVGAANFPRLNVYPGGQLIRIGDDIVGAIGVSGAGIEEDVAVAQTWQDVVNQKQ